MLVAVPIAASGTYELPLLLRHLYFVVTRHTVTLAENHKVATLQFAVILNVSHRLQNKIAFRQICTIASLFDYIWIKNLLRSQ